MTTTNTTVTQGGLQPSGNYTIWVRAIDANGSPSLWSQAFPLSTVMDNVAPNPPVGDPTVDFTSSNLVVSWTASSPMPNDFQDYAITFTKTDNSANVVKYSTTNSYTLTYADNVAAFGGSGVPSLKVKIQARDKTGNISAYGNEVTATNLAPAAAPDGITGTSLLNSYSVGNASTNTPSDLGYIEILQYSASSGGTGTSKYKGLGFPVVISATGGSTVYITSRFVDAFGQQGPEPGTRTSIVVGAPLSSDTTPPDTPSTGPTVSAVADATDPSGATSIATVSWTVAALSGNNADVAGYKLNITSGSTIDYTLDLPRNGIAGGATYTVKVPGLNSSATYNFKYAAYDEFSNVSGYSPSTSQLMPADSTPPGTPSTPTSNTKRNSTKILFEHAITDSGGTALAVDTAQLEVHIGASSNFTASSANTSANTLLTKVDASRFVGNATTPMVWLLDYPDGTYVSVTAAVANGTTVTYTAPGHVFTAGNTAQISGVTGAATGDFSGTFPVTAVSGNTFTVTNNATGTATIGTTACAALARWMRIKAVDKVGNVSSTPSAAYLIPLQLVNSTFGSIIVGDANIGNLSAGKLTAGTAFINDLNVFSTLKVGDTSGTKPGYIQSFDYNVGTGPNTGTGWKIGHNGTNYVFDINNGSISAGALEIQTALNMLKSEHSVFAPINPVVPPTSSATFFTTNTSVAGTIRLNNCAATIDTDYTASPAGSYYMRVATPANASGPFVELASYEADGTLPTPVVAHRRYLNLPVGSYIVSAWIKGSAATGQSCSFNLSNTGTTGTAFSIDNTWKRYSATISITSEITDGSVIIGVPTSTTEQVVQIRGIQLEKKVGSIDTPSPFTVPGGTVINGSMIKTGSIASSLYKTGSTGWAIDLTGNSEFNNIIARGEIRASTGYIGGLTNGWKIDSNLLSNNTVGIYAPNLIDRVNLVTNPSFEVDTTGWINGSNANIATDTTTQYVGLSSLKATPATAAAIKVSSATGTSGIPVSTSTIYAVSAYVKATSTTARNASITVTWYNGATAGTTTAASNVSISSASGWVRLSTLATSPSSAVTHASININYASAGTGEILNIDAVMFEKSSFIDTYFDGNTTGASWAGAINGSTSTLPSSVAGRIRKNLAINPSFEFATLSPTTSANAGTMTYTVAAGHGLTVGSTYPVYVYGSDVGGYNGNYTVTAATATTLTTAGSGTGSSSGTTMIVGWQQYNTTTFVNSTTQSYLSSTSALVTNIGNANTTNSGIITTFAPEAGKNYYFSAYLRNMTGTFSAGTYTVALQVVWGDTTTSTATTTLLTTDNWKRVSLSAVAPQNSGIATLRIITAYKDGGTLTAGGTVAVDGVLIEQSSALSPYFDGLYSTGATWSGAVNASSSSMPETAFYAGGIDRSSAPFMVKYDGSLFATNANVAGTVSGTLINAGTLTVTPKSSSDSLTFNLYNNTSEGKLGNSVSFSNNSIFSKYIVAPTGTTEVTGIATNSRADGFKTTGFVTLNTVTGAGFDTTMTIYTSVDGGTTWIQMGTGPILTYASALSSGNQTIGIPFPYSFGGWDVGQRFKGVKGGTGGSTLYSGLTNTTTPLFVGATDSAGTASTFKVTTAGDLTTRSVTTSATSTIAGLSVTGSFTSGHHYPSVTNSYNLGQSGTLVWANLYVQNSPVVSSDMRQKNEIQESNLGLDFINLLRPVSYKFNDRIRRHYGLIAQEVRELINPDDFAGWVLGDLNDENSQQSLRYEEFISPMIKAIQELSSRNKELENRLAALENK